MAIIVWWGWQFDNTSFGLCSYCNRSTEQTVKSQNTTAKKCFQLLSDDHVMSWPKYLQCVHLKISCTVVRIWDGGQVWQIELASLSKQHAMRPGRFVPITRASVSPYYTFAFSLNRKTPVVILTVYDTERKR